MGLEPFQEADAQFFFGREKLQELIADNLKSFRLTLVYGPSGVGKSSLLQAGVSYHLKQLATSNRLRYGKPRLAVGLIEDWHGDPLLGLTQCLRDASIDAVGDYVFIPEDASLAKTIQTCSEAVGGEMLIILDQFEQFFLRGDTRSGERFLNEFIRLVSSRRSAVNFLISIREDAYTKLDVLKDDIFNLFDNSIPIAYLDREAAERAIKDPLVQYNLASESREGIITIEPELVDAVLNDRVIWAEDVSVNGATRASKSSQAAAIQTSFLQIVMKRLWASRIERGVTRLTAEMLRDLGGAKQIVHERLLSAIDHLSDEEKDIAAKAFHYLVTPSNTKIPLSISDLTGYTECDSGNLTLVLEKLAASRLLRTNRSAGLVDEARYEIFHDVLARAINGWRRDYVAGQKRAEEIAAAKRLAEEQTELAEQQRRRADEQARIAQVRRRLAISMFFMFVIASTATVVALVALKSLRREKQRNEVVDIYNDGAIGDTYDRLDDDSLIAVEGGLRPRLEDYRKSSDQPHIGLLGRNLAALCQRLGRRYKEKEAYSIASSWYQKGEVDATESLKALESFLSEDDPYVASILNELAVINYAQGKFTEAEPSLRRSVEIVSRRFGPNHRDILPYLDNLAAFNDTLGRYRQAQTLYSQVLSIQESSFPANEIGIADALRKLAGAYLNLGKYEEAEWRLNEALDMATSAIAEKNLGASTLSPFLNGLGQLRKKQKRYQDAERLLKEQWSIDMRSGIALELAYDKTDLGLLYCDEGRFAEAEPLLKEALAKLRNAMGVDYLYGSLTRRGLASVYLEQKRYSEAGKLFEEALAIQEQLVGPDHPYVADTLEAYAHLMHAKNDEPNASQMEERARQIRERQAKENEGN